MKILLLFENHRTKGGSGLLYELRIVIFYLIILSFKEEYNDLVGVSRKIKNKNSINTSMFLNIKVWKMYHSFY